MHIVKTWKTPRRAEKYNRHKCLSQYSVTHTYFQCVISFQKSHTSKWLAYLSMGRNIISNKVPFFHRCRTEIWTLTNYTLLWPEIHGTTGQCFRSGGCKLSRWQACGVRVIVVIYITICKSNFMTWWRFWVSFSSVEGHREYNLVYPCL